MALNKIVPKYFPTQGKDFTLNSILHSKKKSLTTVSFWCTLSIKKIVHVVLPRQNKWTKKKNGDGGRLFLL